MMMVHSFSSAIIDMHNTIDLTDWMAFVVVEPQKWINCMEKNLLLNKHNIIFSFSLPVFIVDSRPFVCSRAQRMNLRRREATVRIGGTNGQLIRLWRRDTQHWSMASQQPWNLSKVRIQKWETEREIGRCDLTHVIVQTMVCIQMCTMRP